MDRFLISIVTPAYNSQEFIGATIQSVQKQSYDHWEMLIIDDGSTDKTIDIIQEFQSLDDRIKLLRNDVNSGPAVSRNRGIERASGDFLTFLDADDIWAPHFLRTSLNTCVDNGYDFVFASYRRLDENLEPLLKDFIVPERVSYNDILKTCPISCLTAFLNIKKIGKYYMPLVSKRQDYGLWLSILKDVDYAYGIKEPLAAYRIRKDSVSRNKFKAMLYVWRIYRDVEKINFFRSCYLMFRYSVNGFIKYRS